MSRLYTYTQLFEKSFVVISLIIFSEGLIPIFRKQSGDFIDLTQGDQFMQATWILIYAITIFLLMLKWKEALSLLFQNKVLLILILFVLSSVIWSFAYEISLRRTLGFMGTTSFGLYLAVRFKFTEIIRLILWTLGSIILLSLIFVLFLPSYGISSGIHDGAWQGIYVHKNIFGRFMALSAVFFLISAKFNQKNFLLFSTVGIISVILLFLSTSKTSLVILLIMVCLMPFFKILRWQFSIAVATILFLSVILTISIILVLGNTDIIFSALGRDETLTGRTDLWEVVIQMINQRPFFGYGYGAFWLGWEGDSSTVWLHTGWQPTHSHNGFLDICLDLGFIGLLIFLSSYFKTLLAAVRYLRNNSTLEALWPITFLTFMILYNMTESIILRQNNIFWVIYLAISFSLIARNNVKVTKKTINNQWNEKMT